MRVFSAYFLIVTIAVLAAFLVALSTSSSTVAASSLNEDIIRCKVCERAITYVWDEGEALREHCKQIDNHDPRCDYNQLHHFGIEELVHDVCDRLPRTHQAIEGSEFDLVLKDVEKDGEPDHTEEVANLIRNTCLKWVHQEHSIKQVALYIFANLDANKPRKIILRGLVDRYCGKRACRAEYTQSKNVENDHQSNARYMSKSKSDL